MVVSGLRDFIKKSEDLGVLKRIDGADWNLELSTLSFLYHRRKSVLFNRVSDCPEGYRILTNVIATEAQQNLILGIPVELGNLDAVRYLKQKINQFKPMSPVVDRNGPVLENVLLGDKIDLMKFPTPLWHELDGGRYIGTFDLVIMKDPETGWINIGTYRVMLHDAKTTGLYISPGKHGRLIREKYWAKGESCPVAIVCGMDPTYFVISSLRYAYSVPEYDYITWLKGKPAHVIEAPITKLPVPATSEMVIEGEMPPDTVESRSEGPFGEWTGYYASGARNEPVVHVKSILHRNDPILTGTSPSRIPSETRGSIPLSAMLWNQLEQVGVPGIHGVWFLETGSHLSIAISIKQMYNGHARQAGMAVAGCGQGAYLNRLIIVLDDDIDPTNEDDVWWAVASRCDPATSIDIIPECWSSPLDPRMEPEKKDKGYYVNSKAIIYACKPYHWIQKFPPVVRTSQETIVRVMDKYQNILNDISDKDKMRITRGKITR